MCVCVCLCVYVCMYVCLCVYVCMYVCVYNSGFFLHYGGCLGIHARILIIAIHNNKQNVSIGYYFKFENVNKKQLNL